MPRIGRSNNTIDAAMINPDDASEIRKYGSVLPMMKEKVSIGAIRTCSIVPDSFSRTTDRAVEVTAVIMPI